MFKNKLKRICGYRYSCVVICVQTTSFTGFECVNCTSACEDCTSKTTELNSVLSMCW